MNSYKLINGFKVRYCDSITSFIDSLKNETGLLMAVNAEKIYHSNPLLKEISNKGIAYPDGIGAVLALKIKGVKKTIRIPGCELWLDMVKAFKKTKTFYIIGSTDSVLNKVVSKLKFENQEIKILGYQNGYFKDEEINLIIDELKIKKPDIIFVALGSPKQELLMKSLHKNHKALYMGLGGSLDIFAGEILRSPKIFRDNGLEWFYRLISDPKRIKRQKVLIPFLFNLIRGKY